MKNMRPLRCLPYDWCLAFGVAKVPRLFWRIVFCGVALVLALDARADSALIAVASNFAPALETLRREFEGDVGCELGISSGSTGKLYAQIARGAPFDVLLAADQARPRLLEASGHAVQGSRFTYARGRLALWSRDPHWRVESGPEILRSAQFRHIAIANPSTAPYGVAAWQVLQALGLANLLEPKLVKGENVAQALAFVASGSAEIGFVALSGALDQSLQGSFLEVPADLHAPIFQDAVLLAHGQKNPVAKHFLSYLQSPRAQQKIAAMGYDVHP